MRWMTSGASCGRNVFEYTKDGETIFKEKNKERIFITKDGDMAEKIVIEKKGYLDENHNSPLEYNLKTHLKYFNFYKEWRNGILIKYLPYGFRKESRHGIGFDKTKLLLKEPGKLVEKYYRGSKCWEEFYYSNHKLAYRAKHNSSEIEVFYPNKKLWISLTGEGKTFQMRGWGSSNILDLINSIFAEDWGLVNNTLNGNNRNFILKIYDINGEISHSGEVKEGQLSGEWLWNKEVRYLMQGVLVNEKIFKTPAEQLDPNEVLTIENAQLRSALFNKIGYEKVIQKCNGKVIHTDGDMSLFSIPLVRGKITNSWGTTPGDDILMLLKVRCPSTGVYYVLRVPPDVTECEQARQWTFGKRTRPVLNNETKQMEIQDKPENYFQFVEET